MECVKCHSQVERDEQDTLIDNSGGDVCGIEGFNSKHMAEGDAVQVAGYSGVAWRVIGPHTENQWVECLVYDESVDDDGTYLNDDVYDAGDWEEVETGQIDVHMVGDDRTFTFDPEELTPLSDEDFCGSCGQIGCGWH